MVRQNAVTKAIPFPIEVGLLKSSTIKPNNELCSKILSNIVLVCAFI